MVKFIGLANTIIPDKHWRVATDSTARCKIGKLYFEFPASVSVQ